MDVCMCMSAPSASSADATSVASQCAAVETCYEGGVTSSPCTVADGGCPVCVTFADDGCYVKVSGACPFGNDCTDQFSATSTSGSASATSASASATSSTAAAGSNTGTTSTGTSSASASANGGTAGVSSSFTASGSGSSATAAGDSSSGGSDMSVVFAIIGAAIGVIAVAVIFLTLVRRSRAANDEDDDLANTPPAFSKNAVVQPPTSTTGTANYSSYAGSGRSTGLGSGSAAEIGIDVAKGGSSGVATYYSQQPPQNSTAPSPRVAGRAFPSQPVGVAAPNPMQRPVGSQNYGQMAAAGQAPPTPVQHLPMGGVAPSPHTRRESYEF
ncbi:hypothetical protein BBJ28_00022928 [Nothophytophthora sp. Chile5]|nr:hypothetical protein BBJ28_00022928 [Nothophytophthora sp. Chile5]